MENNLELQDKLNSVFKQIEEAVDNDNIIKLDEFEKIQSLKKELNVSNENIHDNKKREIERILYLQYYLLTLDDNINISERKEIEYYRDIFGYSDDELSHIEEKVRRDKQRWSDRT